MSKTQSVGAGLFAGKDRDRVPVPLAGVTIDAHIRTFFARVEVSHRYVNREDTPIEAVYVFPLDERSAVCGFEAVIDGTLVVGEVLERDKAFERYDDAMAEGHGAYLLDEERPDVFQASIGNLLPGKEVVVKLTYVSELSIADGRVRFVIPTTVSPRYAPEEDRRGRGRPDSEALNPPVEAVVPYGLNLSVHIAMPGAIAAIESPSFPISVRTAGQEATVGLGQSDAALDRDFVLSIEAAGLDTPHAVAERTDDGHEAVAVAFAPLFKTESVPAEVIFLVDRSGSMQGTSIEEVRKALQLCLRSFSTGCFFNIVGFGSTQESLFSESRAYDESSLQEASEFVSQMSADLGGTEILPALRSVVSLPARASLPRQIVVLTDGEVTNTDAVIALAIEHAASARIFTFGIGAGASHHLVTGLARAGRGAAEFIYPGERIEPKVVRQFARLLSPALNDVRVTWTGGSVTQAPSQVPPVFAGDRLLAYGFVKSGRPAGARLTATTPAGPVIFEVTVPDAVADPRRTVSTLAARARIRELEGSPEWIAARGSQQRERKESQVRDEIIALSVRYGLISRETSFVAVERRETPVVGAVQLRRVPVALTSGWGGAQRRIPAMARMTAAYRTSMDTAVHLCAAPRSASPGSMSERLRSSAQNVLGGTDSEEAVAAPCAPPDIAMLKGPRRDRPADALQSLILLQSSAGWWRLTVELASILRRDPKDLRSAMPSTPADPEETSRAWATALALAWLELHAGDREDEWRMLAMKARRWLQAIARPENARWIDAARACLES